VNLASRLESLSQPRAILVSELTQMRLSDTYRLEPNGSIDVKGYGVVHTWFLAGRRAIGGSAADFAEAPTPDAVLAQSTAGAPT
jgi:adenylate cyclase